MKEKGVSGIIATILLVMIAIALVGTAYIYFSGMISGRTDKTISIQDAYCDAGTDTITLVLSNDGTVEVADSELTVRVGTTDNSASFDFGTIAPHNISVASASVGNDGSNTVLVVSPSNSVRQVVSC